MEDCIPFFNCFGLGPSCNITEIIYHYRYHIITTLSSCRVVSVTMGWWRFKSHKTYQFSLIKACVVFFKSLFILFSLCSPRILINLEDKKSVMFTFFATKTTKIPTEISRSLKLPLLFLLCFRRYWVSERLIKNSEHVFIT